MRKLIDFLTSCVVGISAYAMYTCLVTIVGINEYAIYIWFGWQLCSLLVWNFCEFFLLYKWRENNVKFQVKICREAGKVNILSVTPNKQN